MKTTEKQIEFIRIWWNSKNEEEQIWLMMKHGFETPFDPKRVKETEMAEMYNVEQHDIKTIKEYYAYAEQLSDDGQTMCCLVQTGTGNTKETTNIVEMWLPYSPMKHLITSKIDDEHYVMPHQLIKIKITEEPGKIEYEFSAQEETEEIKDLFKVPNFFEDLNTDFLKGDVTVEIE